MEIDLGPLLDSWRFLLRAIGVTLEISLLSVLLGLTIGVVFGTMRAYGGRFARVTIGVYVDVIRSIPVRAVLVWVYFACPLMLGQALDPTTGGVLALGVHLGAYVTEAIRAGLTSVRAGQMRAALALGMSQFQAVRTIILPQALIR